MATVLVNDLTVEPTTPPRAAPPQEASVAGPKSAAQSEREQESLGRRRHERALRLWAY